MKPIRLTKHAMEQSIERGTDESEIIAAIRTGSREPAKLGRFIYRANFQYNAKWNNTFYPIKQVAPVIVESSDEIIVTTVYTFYF